MEGTIPEWCSLLLHRTGAETKLKYESVLTIIPPTSYYCRQVLQNRTHPRGRGRVVVSLGTNCSSFTHHIFQRPPMAGLSVTLDGEGWQTKEIVAFGLHAILYFSNLL